MSTIQVLIYGAGLIIVFLAGWLLNSRIGQSKIANAERFAQKITEDAMREAESIKRTAELEAKDEWYKAKLSFEKETEGRKTELERLQMEMTDRERKLDKKVDILNNKERNVQIKERQFTTRERAVRAKDEQLSRTIREQNAKLERIAGMTEEEAKGLLMANLENRVKREASLRAKEIKDRIIAGAEKEGREIIALAIQRCAADHTVESTVSVVALPSDEMKGRIIGREGRNIRSFETCTGIDVIVDDTPEAVILSGFDPIRREIARIALERLVLDGRIHPGRIEEVVEKARQDMEGVVREAGEQMAFEVGISELHEKMIKLLGRLKYRTSYGQNVLQHSKEVAFLAGIMAAELQLDQQTARRAGLLHDIGKAMDHEMVGTHTEIGMELAKKYGEDEVIVNAIAGHHGDVEPTSTITALVEAADAISGSRPGARRETLEGYIRRLERLEEMADSFEGVDKTYAIQAGREVRVMVNCEMLDDIQTEQLVSDIASKIEAEMEYPGQIKVTVIREMRAVDYAR